MSDSPAPDLLESLRAAVGGQYQIERLLGSGGMGAVFLARDVTLDRPVAIKVISPDVAASRTFRQRFLQEARTVAKLRHPNIVAVHSAGEVGGLLYFVMEYVPGESLRDLLDRERCCSVPGATAVLRDLADALDYAHRHGIVHRDIKPENVLLDGETGRAKLTDFGVARALAAGEERMTGTGLVVGTPRYMSPEQASGERELDGRSDVYSLGLVGYEMVAGEPAFTGTTPGSVIVKQMTEPPPPLAGRAKDVPPELAEVIHRALEKDPTARWQTAGEMARALDALSGGTITTRDSALGTRHSAPHHSSGWGRGAAPRRRRRVAAGALALLLLLVLPTAWLLARRGSGVPEGIDPRKSFLVVPFHNATRDLSLDWLQEGSVNMLTLNLSAWSDLQVVDFEHTLDLLRDADLADGRRIGLEEARGLARDAGVWSVVMGRVEPVPDSLIVTGRAYNVATGASWHNWRLSAPRDADPRPLFDSLARELLGLAGAPPMRPELAKSTTSSLEAYRAYLTGVRALNGWSLETADSALGRAIAADSTFALAYYKRALVRGWRTTIGDTSGVVFARLASQHAARLPVRERDLIEAYVPLTQAIKTINNPGTRSPEETRQLLSEAQRRYTQLVARDSTDAEAWYGLGDAYYHDLGRNPQERAALKSKSLRAFDRTIALDSTFHLAYEHRIGIYNDAATQGSSTVLDGDSVVYVPPSDSAQRAYGIERVRAARERARTRAVEDARRWVAADPDAPQAYRALSNAHAAANDPAAAAAALRQAMSRPGARAPEFPYRIAVLEVRSGRPAEALETLREALRTYSYDSLAQRGGSTRILDLITAMSVAAYVGGIDELEQLAKLGARLDPVVPALGPGGKPMPTSVLLDGFVALNEGAMGVEFAKVRRQVDAALKLFDGMRDSPQGQGLHSGFASWAYILSRDTTYLAMLGDVLNQQGPRPTVVQALRALDQKDTARAKQLAATFSRGDTTKARPSVIAQVGFLEAEVLAALGDDRGAVATYEAIDAPRLPLGPVFPDPRWPLYARSFLARGQLYEQLGEREKARASYERFLELWKSAEGDPRLEPQLRMAREGLNRLRDAPEPARVAPEARATPAR